MRMLPVVCAAIGATWLSVPASAQGPEYLPTRTIEHMDDYHGTKVADPYRWLEDETSPETAAWIEAQNAVTFPYLERIPYRQKLLDRVMQLNDYERYSAPSRKGEYFFFSKNEGLQNQSVLFIQKGLDGAPEVLIDPNAWSADGTVQLSAFAPSKDAKHAVYGISRSGSDWQQYKVMELATKRTLPDTVDWAKVSNVAWHGDGFYYSRYPEPPEGHEKASINENHQVFFHKLGTEQAQDALVYEDSAHLQRFHVLDTTEDERFAILEVSERGAGKDGNALFVRDLAKPGSAFGPLVPEITNDTFNVIDNVGDKILVSTNHGAPNWRVVLIDPAKPAEANWQTVLAERPEPIESATTAGGKLFVTYLKDVTTRAYVYSLDGKLENEIALPGPGSAGGFGGPHDAAFVFYTFNSLNVPPTIYRYDIATRAELGVPRAESPGLRRLAVRDEAGVLPEQGWDSDSDVPRLSEGAEARRQQPDAALRVRRLQHRPFADVQRRTHRAARARIRVRVRESARRRRVRRELAPPGHEARQAERVRRLHRGGRVARSRRSTRRPRSSRSRADRTAGCSWAP